MVEDSDLFLFGDDLDALLEALEANDIVDESFNEAVTEVRQIISEFFFLNSLFYAVLRRFYLQFPFFTHSKCFTPAIKNSILRSLPSRTLAETKNIDNIDDLEQLYYRL